VRRFRPTIGDADAVTGPTDSDRDNPESYAVTSPYGNPNLDRDSPGPYAVPDAPRGTALDVARLAGSDRDGDSEPAAGRD
jgi:hypothetical protein